MVRAIQAHLQRDGLLRGAAKGIFDRQTEEAVRAFQQSRKLDADGIVGPDTWRALADAGLDVGSLPATKKRSKTPPHPFLRVGSSGPHVAAIQAELELEPTSVFGAETAAAIRTFQERSGLHADGIVGPDTWAALLRAGLSTVDLPPFGSDGVLALSGAVQRAQDRRRAETLTAYDVVAELLTAHPEYADGRAGSLDLGAAPPDAERLSFADWLARVRPLFDPTLVDRLTTRTVVWGLALLDSELKGRLDQDDFLTAFRANRTEEILSPAGLALVSGTPLPPTEPGSWLPGFSTDATNGVPLLGIRERVEFLASVLTARNLETPLAIGLFGDWGSGKSFFMRCMQERINVLADESTRAEERSEPTLYCSHVRQLTFNAWLYSDGDIWPSFAAQIFRSVTGAADDVQPGETQAEHLIEYQDRLRTLDEQRKEAESKEAALGRRVDEIDEEILQKEAALPALAGDLGPEARVAARLVAAVKETVLLARRLFSNRRQVSPADLLVVLVPLVVAGAALIFGWSWTGTILAAAAGVVALVLNSLRYVDRATRARQEIDALRAERQTIEAERLSRAEDKAAAEQTLGAALELPLLPQYANQQAARWTDRQQLGVVTEIRLAFERLSQMIDASRKARQADPQDRGMLPIDRVVIYIDDLDRCPHDVVVRVLETIKVLLDLPHFVVVVGVDSRWLFRSIEVRFSELLQKGDQKDADAVWSATPQNYLEKIFQYSVVLRPLQEEGFAELIDSLLPPEPTRTDGTGQTVTPTDESTITADIEEGTSDGEDQTREPARAEREPAVPTAAHDTGPDLMPGSLIITRPEVAFMKHLAPLFETPRAAKRLANVYRLLRVSTPPGTLEHADGYEPVLVLLSIGIAFPGLAGEVFRAIAEHPNGTFGALVEGSLDSNQLTAAPRRGAAWEKLQRALSRVSAPGLADRQLETFNDWIPVVTEFSFHPWQELLPAGTRS